MPAHRSRTERWRESLWQIYERNGGIEFSVARAEGDTGPDLVWRVRIAQILDDELVVEAPIAVGQTMRLAAGLDLVCVMAVGQNRWMFRSRIIAQATLPGRNGPTAGLRLKMPETVERCARRQFLRVSTAELRPVQVECWQLLEPSAVVVSELANRETIRSLERGESLPASGDTPISLPPVGPKFRASLLNIGGGGAGLLINKEDHASIDRARMLWIRLDLRPEIAAPLAVTAKLCHTHVDSEQNLYAGVSFDFTFNASHREFIGEQVTKYVNRLQAAQARAA